MTFAKGVTSAYVPMGGVIATDALVDRITASTMGSFLHGSTFGAHPVAAAVAVATIDALRREQHPGAGARSRASAAGPARRDFTAAHDSVGEVRGCGLLLRHRAHAEPSPRTWRSRPSSRPSCSEAS